MVGKALEALAVPRLRAEGLHQGNGAQRLVNEAQESGLSLTAELRSQLEALPEEP